MLPFVAVISISPLSEAIFNPVDPESVKAPFVVILEVPTPSTENVDVKSAVKVAASTSTSFPVANISKSPPTDLRTIVESAASPIVIVLVPSVPMLIA